MSADNRLGGEALSRLAVIIPNLTLRYSGVTATNRMVAPRIATLLETAWLGRDCPAGVRRIGLGGLLRLRFVAPSAPVVWHARRNIEMAVGVALRAFGWPLTLLFTSLAQRNHKQFTRWLIARMDAVIAGNEKSASYLEPGIRARANVINHGIDTARFHPPADRAAAWREGGLPGRYGIGCFGRIREQKGTDLFVEAMCRLLPRYPDFTAVIIGETTPSERSFGAALEARVAQANLSDRIRFLGFRPGEEIPEWYRRMTIYAFTSRNEGFGLTLLEAMASGCALVAARAGAAEILIQDGEDGVLVDAGNADALAAGLEPLLRDPAAAAAMGARAIMRTAAEFTIDAEVAKIAAVYRTMRGQ
ncbi:MAG: glycosyltransferase family 4 protein [Pseudolabrys sp.]|nr:glycosyltransferase family 4 protein [Pseudolabrys sp.]